MIYNKDLPDYSDDMYLKGYQPYEILEALRRTNRKKKKKKDEESIFEKEMMSFIQAMVTATVKQALNEIFEPLK